MREVTEKDKVQIPYHLFGGEMEGRLGWEECEEEKEHPNRESQSKERGGGVILRSRAREAGPRRHDAEARGSLETRASIAHNLTQMCLIWATDPAFVFLLHFHNELLHNVFYFLK